MFKLSVFKINSGKLFHREGPTSEIAFCPVFVLRKGILSFANLFLVSILQRGANLKISLYRLAICRRHMGVGVKAFNFQKGRGG